MSAFIGSNNIKEIYLGNTKIEKVYYGSDLVWQSGGGPSPITTDWTYTTSGSNATLVKYIGTASDITFPSTVVGD